MRPNAQTHPLKDAAKVLPAEPNLRIQSCTRTTVGFQRRSRTSFCSKRTPMHCPRRGEPLASAPGTHDASWRSGHSEVFLLKRHSPRITFFSFFTCNEQPFSKEETIRLSAFVPKRSNRHPVSHPRAPLAPVPCEPCRSSVVSRTTRFGYVSPSGHPKDEPDISVRISRTASPVTEDVMK